MTRLEALIEAEALGDARAMKTRIFAKQRLLVRLLTGQDDLPDNQVSTQCVLDAVKEERRAAGTAE